MEVKEVKDVKDKQDTKKFIRPEILAGRSRDLTANDFRPPFTLGAVPDSVRAVNDQCFNSISALLNHSLRGLASEGIPKFAGYGVLTGLSQNGMIRAGVETRADEMTRKWGKFTGSDDVDILAELDKECNRFKIPEVMNRAAAYCGYYGGCLAFIDTGEMSVNDLANPLILDGPTLRRGSFRGLKLIEPYTVTPAGYNAVNPLADDYFKPQVWYVQGVPVHISRMLYFTENELPTLIRPAYNFFGLSLAQKALDAVSHFTECREAAARLLQKYALTVFKTDMTDILTGGMGETLDRRVKYFTQMRSNDGCAAIDKETEDLVVMTTSLAGVTDLVRQAEEYVAAMFNEPVTKMWGLSPAGFNTGDSDLRNHYDNISSLQQKILYDPMQKITRILQLNLWGKVDDSITFEFNPLSEEDENLKVQTGKLKAEVDQKYMEAGVLSPEEVRQRLIDDPSSGYDGLDPALPINAEEELSKFDELEEQIEELKKADTVAEPVRPAPANGNIAEPREVSRVEIARPAQPQEPQEVKK